MSITHFRPANDRKEGAIPIFDQDLNIVDDPFSSGALKALANLRFAVAAGSAYSNSQWRRLRGCEDTLSGYCLAHGRATVPVVE
jgi:hypothetical protein